MARLAALALALALSAAGPVRAQDLPALTRPVNDFAGVIDAASADALDALIRSLETASGDAVVVATVDTFAPYGDIREFAVQLFANGGRGIGQRGRDNGLLVVVAVEDRQVWVEVGYDLEQFVTDGFAGQVSRESFAPAFARGAFGEGLLEGVSRIAARIADARGVTLQGVRPGPARPAPGGLGPMIGLLVLLALLSLVGRTRRRRLRRWGGGGWHSGVGPFGGGFGGFGGGGGGFGGGFGGFGGGRSGGGGGGARW